MEDLMMLKDMLPVLIPIVIFQLGFQIYCLILLVREEKVKFNNKWIWVALIVGLNLIGGILFLAIGREDS